MARTKIVVEGAAAAPVGALLNGLMDAEPGETVVCVLSGGNLKLDQLSGLSWN
jgi:threonine dehydratase